MPVQFENWPALLLLTILLSFFWWQHRRTVTDMSLGRKRVALLFRCLLALLLVLALAGTRLVRKSESLAVVFLVDASRSIRDNQRAAIQKYLQEAARGMRSVDKVGVITFAQEPYTQSAPGQLLDPARLRDSGATGATNIAQALRQARSELDTAARSSGKRIVLISDGNENVGRALGEAAALAASRIQLDTVTLPVTLPQEALIERMALPGRVKIGEPFPVRVVVASRAPQTGVVTLLRDGKPAGSRSVELRAGKNVVAFDQNIEKPGFFRYSATLNAPQDTIPENNKGEGFVWVRGKPSVLYVADDPALTTFLRKSLQSQNITIEYAPPEALPTTVETLQRFDSILLSNVYAGQFTPGQMRALQVACRDFGIGLGMIGGENSFGAGGYRGTPIEEALPVSLDARKTLRFPSVSIALVVDRSGSMAMGDTGVNKLALAREAAIRAVQSLKPTDNVAIISFDSEATLHVPLTSAAQKEQVIAGIHAINPGGGTSIYSGAKMAFDVLSTDPTPIKHIILLTDGVSNDPDYRPLVAAMKQRRITLSSIAISAGTRDIYSNTLVWLARETGGRFFMVENAQQVPGLYLQEIERITSPPIVEEPFRAIAVEGEEIFKGIAWEGAPPLLGYNISILKPTADLSLVTPRKDPLFAGWRYGLGRSIAFLSDDRARWGAQWLGWPGYARFWAQAVRWTLRSNGPSDYATQVTLEGHRGHIVVDAIDEQGRYVNKLQLRARIVEPDTGGGRAASLPEEPLRQTAPGHYEGWFDASKIGTYLVNVLEKSPGREGQERSTVVGLSTAYSPEYRDTEANRYLMTHLAQLGGGRVDPPAPVAFGGNRPGVFSPTDMVPWLVLLAMLLLPLDIAARRLSLTKEDFRRALDWISERKPRGRPERAATPELVRLLDRKESVAARHVPTASAVYGTAPSEEAVSEQVTAPRVERSDKPFPVPLYPASAHADASPLLRAENVSDSSTETPQEPTPQEEESLSRLLAAKRRAQRKNQT